MRACKEGWGFPTNSQKAHYFIAGRSLCSKWMYFGELEQGNDNSSDNCIACKRALAKKQTKALIQEVKRRGGIKF